MEKHFLRAQEDMGCSGTSSCFFTWNNLRKQNIVIIDHLSKKKKNIVIIEWCCIYRYSEETVQYFLLHCLEGMSVFFFFFLGKWVQIYLVSCDCIIQCYLVYVKDCDSNVGLLARTFSSSKEFENPEGYSISAYSGQFGERGRVFEVCWY